jgi:hypothetical protein
MWPFYKSPAPASCTKKHAIIFAAGAAAFHTLSHIMFAFSGKLPMHVWGMDWTQGYNLVTIVVSAVITAGLLFWASKE